MPEHGETFDLAQLKLLAGAGRRIDHVAVPMIDLELGNQHYGTPDVIDATLDVSRMTGDGYALRLRFSAAITGPCMRCLGDAAPEVAVDAREVHDEGAGTIEDSELTSPYVRDEQLDIGAWAHDALALAMPAQILCRPDCAGLCPECGADLNAAQAEGVEHHHRPEIDPRWDALRELKLD